jgi:magnesium protoporphyrin O-methyltransferase
MTNAVDDKTIVKEYFNATGFERWRRIYGDGEVNKVQNDIRIGHQQTIDTIIEWLKADDNLSGLTICDAGCGVGSLSIPLAQAGAILFSSDISEKMVEEARTKAQETLGDHPSLTFAVQDSRRNYRKISYCLLFRCVDPLSPRRCSFDDLPSCFPSRVSSDPQFCTENFMFNHFEKNW